MSLCGEESLGHGHPACLLCSSNLIHNMEDMWIVIDCTYLHFLRCSFVRGTRTMLRLRRSSGRHRAWTCRQVKCALILILSARCIYYHSCSMILALRCRICRDPVCATCPVLRRAVLLIAQTAHKEQSSYKRYPMSSGASLMC